MKQPLIFKPEFHSMVKSCSRVIYAVHLPIIIFIAIHLILNHYLAKPQRKLLNACGGNQVLLSALEGPFTA